MPTAKPTSKQTVTPKLSAPVLDVAGQPLRTVNLAPELFAVTANPALVSEVLVSAQANQRHPIADTLHRGEVRGGGRKPWRQKGTGRARQGSTRSPHWRHGGVAFGPTSARNFSRKINVKAHRAVVRMLLSALATDGHIRAVDGLGGNTLPTTKAAATFLNAVAGTARRPLLLTATADRQLLKSARNLGGVLVRSLERLGVLDLALTDQLILDVAALEPLVDRYAIKKLEAGSSKLEKAEIATGPNLQTPASSVGESTKPAVKRSKKKTATAGVSRE